MAKRIDSAMQFVPTFVREEVKNDLARGRRGPFSDAVVPLNDALVERADRIRTLESVVARLEAEREADRAAMRRALEALKYHTEQTRPIVASQVAIHDLRQRLEGTT